MSAVEVSHLSYSYGDTEALRDLDFTVPEGALYALLGPNGSGKTTLLQLLMGLRRPAAGRVALLGVESRALTTGQRSRIGYIAEGQPLPGWMRLGQLERYLAPLYPTWDATLAATLRDRFELDPGRRIATLSRGEHMKAALLCALAPRPGVLLMDEPFTGMDALVKDELVRGLLASAGSEGWTVIIASHDIGELEQLADWAGILANGRMRVSEPMDRIRERFIRASVTFADQMASDVRPEAAWLDVERAGGRLTFLIDTMTTELATLARRFGSPARLETRPATLREVFVAFAREASDARRAKVAA